jgi:hypothetical protein
MHIKWQPRHQLAANERNLDWFRFWLAGEVDPDPAKAAQYVRWRGYGSPSQARTQASVSTGEEQISVGIAATRLPRECSLEPLPVE